MSVQASIGRLAKVIGSALVLACVATPAVHERPSITPHATAHVAVPAAIPARTLERVRADDGHELALHAKLPASPKGALVLLHGRTWSGVPDFDLQVAGHARSLMDAVVRRGWAVYALDLRGYGATPRDASGWNTPDRAAKDLHAVLGWVAARHGDRPPAVLGWSLGSLVAQLEAQRHPESIAALVLYGYPRDPGAPRSHPHAEPKVPPRARNTAAAAASDFISPAVIDQTSIDAFVAAALAADPVRADWRAMDELDALDPSQVRVPTLVIHGARDPFAPVAAQAELFTRLGHDDRTWVALRGGDHAAHLEDVGAAFVHAVLAFLEQPRTP